MEPDAPSVIGTTLAATVRAVRVAAWVEGTPLHVAGLRTLLGSFAPEVEVTTVVGARQELAAMAHRWRPDIVVVHAHRADDSLAERIRVLRERITSVRTVVIAHTFPTGSVERLTSLGVSGVFSAASLSPERLRNALLVVRAGDVVVDPVAVTAAADTARPALTVRQQKILALVVDGMCDDAIARQLAVSTSTVKRDLRRIYEALDTRNRAGAAACAVQAGIVPG